MDAAESLRAVLLVPVVACAVAAVLGRRVRARSTGTRDALAALGVAVAVAGAVEALGARPRLPLAPWQSAWTWVFWFAPAAWLLGLVEARADGAAAARFAARAVVAAAAAFLLLAPRVPHARSMAATLARAGVAGVAAAALGTALRRPARGGGGVVSALPFVASAFAASYVMGEVGLSPSLASTTGAIGVAALATALLTPLRGGEALPAAAAPVLSLTLVSMLVSAGAYLECLPDAAAACFALAPLSTAIPRRGAMLVLAVALVATGLAISIAGA